MPVVPRTGPEGRLYVNPNGVVLLARRLNNVGAPHSHFTASVSVAVNHPLRFRTGMAEPWQEAMAVATAPNTTFQLMGGPGLILNMQIDPETDDFARLGASLWRSGAAPVVLLGERAVQPIRAGLCDAQASGLPIWKLVLDSLGADPVSAHRFDSRIATLLDSLKENIHAPPPAIGQLAQLVGLSDSRTGHLFAEQLGVPLSRYMLWLRVRQVVLNTAFGDNLTDSAHAAGFADSPHFTRVFRSMFGIQPSLILRSSTVDVKLEIDGLPLRGPHAKQDGTRLADILRCLEVTR